MTLDGRHVMVVGLGGMGLSLAQALAADGAVVSACDRDVARIESAGLVGRAVDVTDEDETGRAVESLVEQRGPLWGVCVTAGIILPAADVLAAATNDMRRLMEVNFFGTLNIDRAAARAMVAQGSGGRIVNWSSVGAVGGNRGNAVYGASKAAVETLSLCLAVELAEHQITVNVIRPGSIDTPMIRDLPQRLKDRDVARIPLHRWGTGDDVAHAARMLLAPDAGWITGSVVTVDGGMLAALGRDIKPDLE